MSGNELKTKLLTARSSRYEYTKAARILGLVVGLAASGCASAGCQTTASVIEGIQCDWSSEHDECFCVAYPNTSPTITWAPPETCGVYYDDCEDEYGDEAEVKLEVE